MSCIMPYEVCMVSNKPDRLLGPYWHINYLLLSRTSRHVILYVFINTVPSVTVSLSWLIRTMIVGFFFVAVMHCLTDSSVYVNTRRLARDDLILPADQLISNLLAQIGELKFKKSFSSVRAIFITPKPMPIQYKNTCK